jgi:hypothetical protein
MVGKLMGLKKDGKLWGKCMYEECKYRHPSLGAVNWFHKKQSTK